MLTGFHLYPNILMCSASIIFYACIVAFLTKVNIYNAGTIKLNMQIFQPSLNWKHMYIAKISIARQAWAK